MGLLASFAFACGPRTGTSHAEDDPSEAWFQSASAGSLGCQPERVAIAEARAVDAGGAEPSWTWVARCENAAVVCSSAGGTRCSALREGPGEDEAVAANEPRRVRRSLPPEVVACTEGPVAVSGLFDEVGRLVELRPWPGETVAQRDCVTRALVHIDLPEGRGALVVFEPRDPWADDER